MKIFKDNAEEIIKETNYNLEDTYIDQHKAILSGDFSKNCTLYEGFRTMEIINEIQNTREQ